MKKLPNKLKQIIKKKRFSLNTLENTRSWRGGLDIDYRITMVKSDGEDCYDYLTPLNTEWGTIYVNIKVKGSVEMAEGNGWGSDKWLTEISKATKTRRNGWGGYETNYDSLWGRQSNKKIRSEIRSKVRDEIKDYLKLMGITTKSWDGGIKINTINWEK